MPATSNKVHLSAVITTFNNAATLARCLSSLNLSGVPLTDEILVLDSGSTDNSVAIATKHGARIETKTFSNYSEQKQRAIDLAEHNWILLLDADEWLSKKLQQRLLLWRQHPPAADAYRLERREWLLWRWQHRWSKPVTPIRLLDRRTTRMNNVPVHAAPVSTGRVDTLVATALLHTGEADIHTKVKKINAYSSGQAQWRSSRRFLRLRMLVYPYFAFWREYIFRRQFLNGWAGFIAARSAAFYAFVKYAKAYEFTRKGQGDQPPE